jgi:UDP-glucose 4-epimerase
MTRILVTGHSGFIGRNLTPAMDGAGFAWTGIDRKAGFDLLNPGSLDGLRDHSCVVHLAAKSGVMESWQNPEAFHRENFQMTLSALEFARQRKARFVYVSSYMYGVPEYLPIDERHPVACNNPYAWSKRACEILCESYAADFKLDLTILRPFNLFGPFQSRSQVIADILFQAMTSDGITVSDLEPRRDYLWVGDFIDVLLTLIKSDLSGFHVFNVGYGESHSVQDIIDCVQRTLGPRHVTSRQQRRPNEIMDCSCNHALLTQTFGWQPKITLAEGIERLYRHHQDNPI